MAYRVRSPPEVEPTGYTAMVSMISSRFMVVPNYYPETETYFRTTFLDFSTPLFGWRYYIFYCPYGGIVGWPSENYSFDPVTGNPTPAYYTHRLQSIYDPDEPGAPIGLSDDNHVRPGWHVYAEQWDYRLPGIYSLYRVWDFNYHTEVVPSPFVDYGLCYLSLVNNNFASPHMPFAQGPVTRTNSSFGGPHSSSAAISSTPGVSSDTTWGREFFFVAQELFDGEEGGTWSTVNNPYNAVHNVISAETAESWKLTHALTVKPRYDASSVTEPFPHLRGLPMPHGVVMSVWVRDIRNIGEAPARSWNVSPVQSQYGVSTFSMIFKGGMYTPYHVQAM